MYKIKVNDTYSFEIDADDDQLKIDGEPVGLDLVRLSETQSHLLFNHKSYNIEFIEENKLEKTITFKINGNPYHIAIEDQYDQLLKRLGLDSMASGQIKEVKAPMPGLVLNVLVKEGDQIKRGENLLILEAMKMENILKSPADGIVRKIAVGKGDKVDKNQVLVTF